MNDIDNSPQHTVRWRLGKALLLWVLLWGSIERLFARLTGPTGKSTVQAMVNKGKPPVGADDQRPCAGHNLDKCIQPATMAVLVEGPLHGYKIVKRLGQMPTFRGEKPDTTGVYRTLKGMEKRGIVSSSWSMSANGPAKKLFGLTPAGHKCLLCWAKTLEDYRQRIGQLAKQVRVASRRTGRGGK